jgi:hypothetical protein
MTDDKIIKDAQYRKGLSIAFFNATNSAISLISARPQIKDWKIDEVLENVKVVRDFFLEEHKNYYATVIANVGVNYHADESIKKLQDTKTEEELNTTWRMLSADERRDGEIIKIAQKLKKSYKK